jgi:hypothetical protein
MIKQDFKTFQRQNRVHYVANISTMTGNEATIQGRNIGLFSGTAVIDWNHNGRADVSGHENGSTVVYDVAEPAFLTSYRALKEMAQRNGTHIIRQDDVRPVKVGQPGYTINKWVWDRDKAGPHTNKTRYLESLVDEIGAFPTDVKWAIDTHQNRFVVYSPGRP